MHLYFISAGHASLKVNFYEQSVLWLGLIEIIKCLDKYLFEISIAYANLHVTVSEHEDKTYFYYL